MEVALAPFDRELVATVERVLADDVAAGAVRIDVTPGDHRHGVLVEVRPSAAGACPLTLHCEVAGEVDLFLGPHEVTTHLWYRKDPERALAEVAAVVKGVGEGRYAERVRLRRDGSLRTAKGTIELPGGPWRFTHSGLSLWARRGGRWRRQEYAPYRRTA